MRTAILSVVLVLVVLAGCGRTTPVDRVINVEDDDAGMNAAIQKARDTVPTFIAALKAPKPGQESFAVKKAFTDGKGFEHMWISSLTYDGKTFTGTVNNDPERVAGVKIGDRASVEPNQISDWMYVERGKLVGGYSIRLLRDRTPAKERAGLDSTLPFTID